MKQIQVVNNNGHFDCEMDISAEEWLALLNDESMTNRNVWNTLLKFYYRPNREAACSEINPDQPSSVNMTITNWATKIKKAFSNRFEVLGTDGRPSYWIVPMTGYIKDNSFIWILRPELAEAIKEKIFQEVVERYKKRLKGDPTYWNGTSTIFGEKYKWEAIEQFQKHWDIDASNFSEMFQNATSKTKNLLHLRHWYPRELVLLFAKYEPEKIKLLFKNLFDESIDLKQRIEEFIQKTKELLLDMKLHHNQEEKWDNYNQSINSNAVSTYLWLKYPDKYYKFAPKIYFAGKQLLGLNQYNIKPLDGSVDSMLEGFAMYDEIRVKLQKDKELVNMINSLVEKSGIKNIDTDFYTATIDFGYYIFKYYNSDTPTNEEENNMSNNLPENIANYVNLLRFKKNVILQGAPGTGKTYSTAAIALGLLGVKDVDFSNHPAVMKKYEEYRKEKGRIFFTTFHQSMDYEDFVEGLKPKIDKDDEGNTLVKYEVEDGIFKDVCNNAKGKYKEDEIDESLNKEKNGDAPNRIVVTDKSRTIWKVSLGRKNDKNNVFEKSDCFDNNFIWVQGDDYPCDYFKNNMKIDDIVIVLSAIKEFDAIGIVTSDWYKCEGYDDVVKRDVKWLFKNVSYPYSDILKKGFENKQLPIEAAKHVKVEDLDLPKLQELVDKYTNNVGSDLKCLENKSVNSPVILIIDEINRGNVSKIFGELVTLLEADKRSGNGDHPITVKLPYSKKEFSVPSNVYIIGTMNTTDRSTGTLDYAIRRRFAFVTLKADSGVIQLDIAQKLFSNIEAFIKKYRPKDMEIDDLMVGHSYFMTEKEDELKLKIQYEVIPLLKEYCNDGLLTCSPEELDKRIDSWKDLKVYNSSETQAPAPPENPANATAKASSTDDEEDEDQE